MAFYDDRCFGGLERHAGSAGPAKPKVLVAARPDPLDVREQAPAPRDGRLPARRRFRSPGTSPGPSRGSRAGGSGARPPRSAASRPRASGSGFARRRAGAPLGPTCGESRRWRHGKATPAEMHPHWARRPMAVRPPSVVARRRRPNRRSRKWSRPRSSARSPKVRSSPKGATGRPPTARRAAAARGTHRHARRRRLCRSAHLAALPLRVEVASSTRAHSGFSSSAGVRQQPVSASTAAASPQHHRAGGRPACCSASGGSLIMRPRGDVALGASRGSRTSRARAVPSASCTLGPRQGACSARDLAAADAVQRLSTAVIRSPNLEDIMRMPCRRMIDKVRRVRCQPRKQGVPMRHMRALLWPTARNCTGRRAATRPSARKLSAAAARRDTRASDKRYLEASRSRSSGAAAQGPRHVLQVRRPSTGRRRRCLVRGCSCRGTARVRPRVVPGGAGEDSGRGGRG